MYSLLNDLNDWFIDHDDPWNIDQSLIDLLRSYQLSDLKDLRMWIIGCCEGEGPYTEWISDVLEGYFDTYQD